MAIYTFMSLRGNNRSMPPPKPTLFHNHTRLALHRENAGGGTQCSKTFLRKRMKDQAESHKDSGRNRLYVDYVRSHGLSA